MQLLVCIAAFVALVLCAPAAIADCSQTSLGITPLSDSAAETYEGEPGGLYPGGRSTRPAAHGAAGIALANAIVPLDANGDPDPGEGKIVLVSLGMSNARSEFATFVGDANADPSKNPKLVIVNGAQNSQTADKWADPSATAWSNVESALANEGVTPAQVQVAWFKAARPHPAELGEFPDHAEVLASDIAAIARNLLLHFPNVELAYMSSRTRAYTTSLDPPEDLNPEPYAFESGFAVRWVIERQIAGDPDLNDDAGRGDVVAPHLDWGPYLWADGTSARSDGFIWSCNDVLAADFIHPSNRGSDKVSAMLLAFFKTDPTTAPWFLAAPSIGQAPSCSIGTALDRETAPANAAFRANSGDADGSVVEHAWTFGDGTFSFDENPQKRFAVDGDYAVRLTVSDDDGNATVCSSLVVVPEPGRVALQAAALLTLVCWRHRTRTATARTPPLAHHFRSYRSSRSSASRDHSVSR